MSSCGSYVVGAFFRHDLSEDDFVEFSKNVQDRIIGTKDGVAHVS